MSEETKVLNVKNFLDFICDDFSKSPIYLPINTVTPSEETDQMSLTDERKFRLIACEIL
jgi:hypothetical protein